jgi:cell division protease FtsH
VGDIKEALKDRFRPEQIARFGNNIIKYPSLSKENFKEIIEKEVIRICEKFKKEFGISVNVEEDMKELLYAEGVYPVQGVRPVFTTIGTILTPILSKILIHLEEKEDKEGYQVKIGLHGETDFKKPVIRAFIDYSEVMRESISINLPLGEERDPEKRKTRVICSVHEAGHAIVMAYLTGEIPRQIISVSTDHGGFCITSDKERDGEIKTRLDIMNHICIGLAGYEAERLVYGERPEMLLCGSSEDITTCWDEFSAEAYKGGYFGDPYSYSYRDAESSSDGVVQGFDDHEIAQKMRTEFEKLREKTKEILASNRLLLKKMAEILAVKGGMGKEEMRKLVSTNAGTLTESRLEEAKHENDYGWYLNKL